MVTSTTTTTVKSSFLSFLHLSKAELDLILISIFIKVLLFPAYKSTDFEVHRNWLAITNSLPLSEWYFDTTSIWTLDYPPFFAYFEYFLGKLAFVLDPKIVELTNLGYSEWSCIIFQRGSVIVSELVLASGLIQWARRSKSPDYPTAFLIASSVLLHPGLIIIDHIHFQYNGFLLGIMIWSIIAAREDNLYLCATLFSILLNFKHIFIYLAPPYFIFLLRRHCFTSTGKFRADKLAELGFIVITIFTISFGPFLAVGGMEQIKQIGTRLFPFQRGLNHAYWAGNVWSLWTGVDRVLVKYLSSRGIEISSAALASSSRGLIGSTTFGVLPNITPLITFSLTVTFIFIYLTKLWFDPSYKRFLDCLILSGMTSFLWGWHVHEKAVMLFLVPLSLTAVEDYNHFRSFLLATTAGIISLFPLLINSAETPIKLIYTLLYILLLYPSLQKVVYQPLPNLFSHLVTQLENLYLFGFIILQLYVEIGHSILFGSKEEVEFLPLMMISLYCAVGLCWSWCRLSWNYTFG